MRKDKQLLQRAYKDLERIWFTVEYGQLAGPDESMMSEIRDHLKDVLNPPMDKSFGRGLVYVKAGDECDVCSDPATTERVTHTDIHRLCETCAKAYDLGVMKQKAWSDRWLTREIEQGHLRA